MRPLTIVLLVTAVAAFLVGSLTQDGQVALVARLMYCAAFVASIIAFARGLPRTPENPPQTSRGSRPPPSVSSLHG